MTQERAERICNTRDLGLLVWREARGESPAARLAVAFSVLNRVVRPSWWGTTLEEVMWKKWQYSSLTAPGDPQLALRPRLSDPTWVECLSTAEDALLEVWANPVPGADSYYDDSITPPKWTAGARLVAKIGRLTFFDVDNDWEVTK